MLRCPSAVLNTPVGIAVGALLWAYLDVTGNPLQIIAGVSSEIVTVMQGVIVLSVVVAYELVRRYRLKLEQRQVGQQNTDIAPAAEPKAVLSGPS